MVNKLFNPISENDLRSKKMISKNHPYYFADSKGMGKFAGVEDDHLPFLAESEIFNSILFFAFNDLVN